MAKSSDEILVSLVTLADFPFTPFKKVIKGESEPETKYPSAWRWLLLLYFFDSFMRDNGRKHIAEKEFVDNYEGLQDLGLVPNPNFRRAVLRSSKSTFSADLGKVKGQLERTSDRQDATDLLFFVDSLQEAANGMRGDFAPAEGSTNENCSAPTAEARISCTSSRSTDPEGR